MLRRSPVLLVKHFTSGKWFTSCNGPGHSGATVCSVQTGFVGTGRRTKRVGFHTKSAAGRTWRMTCSTDDGTRTSWIYHHRRASNVLRNTVGLLPPKTAKL